MWFTSLGSGSKGNATLVRSERSHLLIDSGFSCRELEIRLSKRNTEPESVKAILVTHEHSDHMKGVATFANKYEIPVYMSRGTSLHHLAEKINNIKIISCHKKFSIDDFEITPVTVPHDAREACQFIVESNNLRLGILTDLGHITRHIESSYYRLDGLMLEFNHDVQLLQSGSYPRKLKARVGGQLGHLNNTQAVGFLTKERIAGLKKLVAVHLSEENNSRTIVQSLLESVNVSNNSSYTIASQETGFDWLSLT
ncbi:MBL fold metallo-hydrolase [Aliikangiella sp. G2MR2-5]|uniref:MBL fold metallo-hydrolase n=1 Tax=Aliikangiella sp. G2MR2-5 TaxID=2788943 RepID=UPI0018ABEE6A